MYYYYSQKKKGRIKKFVFTKKGRGIVLTDSIQGTTETHCSQTK